MKVSIKINAEVILDNTGSKITLPVIVTEEGVLMSFAKYLVTYRNKSPSWHKKSVQAVQLLLDYYDANQSVFANSQEMFREFSHCLYTGTVDTSGNDPSGLRWEARSSANAESLIKHVTHYTDWLALKQENESLRLNPYVKADSFEEQMNRVAFYQKRDRAFLSHLQKPTANQFNSARAVKMRANAGVLAKSYVPKTFPDEHFDALLERGFIRYGHAADQGLASRFNLRDMLITILMHYGSLRVSETMHLYMEDIEPDKNGSCIVRVHHPELGLAPGGKMNRTQYLKQHFGLPPRNTLPTTHTQHAGWKKPMLNDNKRKCFEVFWFPAEAGVLFRDLWVLYLSTQRKTSVDYKHPYAFCGKQGNPATIKAFGKSHARAVEAIGLQVSKDLGTTPHGHRHAYGSRLMEAGVDQLVIKNCMHHASIESSGVYTEPGVTQLRNTLSALDSKLDLQVKKRIEQGKFAQIEDMEKGYER